MELFAVVIMERHGKMCPTVYLFLGEPVTELLFTVEKAVLDKLLRIHHFNPLIPDNIADPSLSKFGDTYYLYGTTDIDKGLSQAGTPVVWKSKDFVNWSFDGSHIVGFDWHKGHEYVNAKGEKKRRDIFVIGHPAE